MDTGLIDDIDALLPQTQCQKCGFKGCRPYAEAIVQGIADINQCPPGGVAGIEKLAAMLGVATKPLSAKHGQEGPRLIAKIIEADCIGCTKCLPPCPVDAILGTSKHMHTVISSECTGCELCIAPCPVNCIIMVPAASPNWTETNAALSRQRYLAKNRRIEKLEAEKTARLLRQKELLANHLAAKTRE